MNRHLHTGKQSQIAMSTDGALSSAKSVGDLISISAPAVVSLTEVERLRDRLGAGDGRRPSYRSCSAPTI